jgi:hypothetical protein
MLARWRHGSLVAAGLGSARKVSALALDQEFLDCSDAVTGFLGNELRGKGAGCDL